MNKKSIQIKFDKAKRDEDLMFPLHKTDLDHPERESFIRDLYNSEDFVKVNKQNDKKYEESLRSLIKNFGPKDYILAILLALSSSGMFYGLYSNELFHHDDIESANKRLALNTIDLCGIVILAIGGFYFGKAITGSIKQTNNEMSIDRLYHRMATRLFLIMSRKYPELNVETLEHCNPEMSRVIKALVMTNMPERDVLELHNIAKTVREYKYSKLYKGEIDELNAREKALERALNIVKRNMLNNPELADTILGVYRGKIPKTFVLQPNQRLRGK